MNTDPPRYSPRALFAALVLMAGISLACAVYVLPPLAEGVRANVRAEELGTARALAATARAPTPTRTPLPVTPVPTEVALIQSGGIGLERERWESVYGQPDPRSGHFIIYGSGTYIVEFLDDRVAYIERIWDEGQQVSLADARLVASLLLPFDSALAAESEPAPGANEAVEIYSSGRLREILRSNRPQDEMSGDVRVEYQLDGERVTAVMLTVVGYTPQNPSR